MNKEQTIYCESCEYETPHREVDINRRSILEQGVLNEINSEPEQQDKKLSLYQCGVCNGKTFYQA